MNNLASPQLGLSGQYRAEIRRNNQLILETDWFDNLITDYGLNLLGETTPTLYCKVGTGTNVPTILDSTLTGVLGTTLLPGATGTNSLAPNYISSLTYACAFAQGAVVGNITEVAIASSTNLFSRALITDSSGNPVSLSLLAIDQLTIYYKLNIKNDPTTFNGNLTLNSTDYTYSRTLANPHAAFTNGAMLSGRFFSAHSFALYNANNYLGAVSETFEPYIPNSLIVKTKLVVPIGTGNHASGITAMSANNTYNGNQSYGFSPSIMKTSVQVLTLNFSRTWSRG